MNWEVWINYIYKPRLADYFETINHVVVNHSTIQPFHHQPGRQSSNPKTAPGCLGDLLGMKCYPVKWEFFEMNHDMRIFRPFFVPQVGLTTSNQHHFTISPSNVETIRPFYFHFNPQNKAVWRTLPHLTFPVSFFQRWAYAVDAAAAQVQALHGEVSQVCWGQTFDDVLAGWQDWFRVGSRGDETFFWGRNFSTKTKNPQQIWLVKGMVKAPYQLLDIKQLYIHRILYIQCIYSESSKNTGKNMRQRRKLSEFQKKNMGEIWIKSFIFPNAWHLEVMVSSSMPPAVVIITWQAQIF